jgi:NADPH2:quinone reductase
MRAAIIEEMNTAPVVGVLPRPVPGPAEVLVEVLAAGLNPHDLVVAAGVRVKPPLPYVAGIEGVGRLADGTRVYFSPGPLPSGSIPPPAPTQSWSSSRSTPGCRRIVPHRDGCARWAARGAVSDVDKSEWESC